MGLRQQSFMGIFVTTFILIAVTVSISRLILLDNLKRIEESSALRNIERAVNAVSYTLSDIEMSASDWAQWDETYTFIDDINKEYIIDNLADETLDGLRLNMMVFVDLSGQIIYSKGYDLDTDEEVQIPSELQNHLLAVDCPFILAADSGKGVAGVIVMAGYPPLMVAAQPIMTSAVEGPTKGSLLFGRFLGETEINRLSQLTQLNLALDDYDIPKLTDKAMNLVFPPNLSPSHLVREEGGEHIFGYAVFMDTDNMPALTLKVEMGREVYLEGQRAVAYLVAAIALAGLLLGLVAMVAADRFGVSRLKRLSEEVDAVSLSGEITGIVDVRGRDEIASLAASINRMLTALQDSDDKLREKAEQLQLAVIEAQAANQAKSDFLSSMSHELKTPLTAIIGITQLLQKQYYGPLNEEQEEYIRDLLDSSNHLLGLINEILDYARMEAGKTMIELAPVTIEELLSSSIMMVKELASGKKIEIISDIPQDISKVIIPVDKRRFVQILTNLLSNAVRYTANGGLVTISAQMTKSEIIFFVKDTGIGINQDERTKIFEAFYQIYSKVRGKSQGMGLGLSVAKRLVELHGGKIWVESEGEGKGSIFGFSIPLSEDTK